MGCGFGAYYGLTGLYPTLLDGLGHTPAAIAHYVMLFNFGMMGGAIVTGVLAAKKGVARAVAVPALASLPFLPLYVGAVPALLGVGAFFGGGLAVGFSGVTPLFLTGLFPPEVRARAVGVVYHVGALFAAFVPTAMAFLVQHAHVPLPRAILVVADGVRARPGGAVHCFRKSTTGLQILRGQRAEASRRHQRRRTSRHGQPRDGGVFLRARHRREVLDVEVARARSSDRASELWQRWHICWRMPAPSRRRAARGPCRPAPPSKSTSRMSGSLSAASVPSTNAR